jgi:hypothetical protein
MGGKLSKTIQNTGLFKVQQKAVNISNLAPLANGESGVMRHYSLWKVW